MCSYAGRFTLILLLTAFTGGCSPIMHRQGKLPEKEEIEKIVQGVHTREDVIKILGSPTAQSTFDKKVWYYISKLTSQEAFFEPKVLDQQVLAISFDNKGLVQEITKRDLSDKQDINYVERITETEGHSGSLASQVFGNFGRMRRE